MDEPMDPQKWAAIAACMEERDKVLRGECPGCGGRIDKTLDERQVGYTEVQGLWHRVTCRGEGKYGISSCGYWADWCIPPEGEKKPPPFLMVAFENLRAAPPQREELTFYNQNVPKRVEVVSYVHAVELLGAEDAKPLLPWFNDYPYHSFWLSPDPVPEEFLPPPAPSRAIGDIVGYLDRGAIYCARRACQQTSLVSIRFGVLPILRGKGVRAGSACCACGDDLQYPEEGNRG